MKRECPDCGELCAQAWCGFCERMLPPRGCAFTKCDDPACYFCVVMPEKFRIVHCPNTVDEKPCRYVSGHPGPCKPSTRTKRDANVLRDGEAATKHRDPTFVPRRRVGPHR